MQTELDNSEQRFVEHLVSSRAISQSDAARLESARRALNSSYVLLLSRMGLMQEHSIVDHLVEFLRLPRLDEGGLPPEPLFQNEISQRFLTNKSILPVDTNDNVITLAVADPFDRQALHAITVALKREIDLVLAEPSRVARAIEELYEADHSDTGENKREAEGADYDGDIERLKDLATEAPVIKYVNELFLRASDLRASDIHLEPFKADLLVRFRIDGMLREMPYSASIPRAAVISRIKLLARLDISERRLPQDGRIKATVRGRELDLRISTYPTMYGESAVIRLLDKASSTSSLDTLGIADSVLDAYREQLSNPSGVTLVVGPTGSGKTTTLYATLLELSRPEVKIFTVEDPIEYELLGVNQCQIKPQIGLTFANSLRSMLRQDPDVILVGEIRDGETAEICAQAALTGHKVFSTLHTTDATSAITRLLDLGLQAFLLTATIDSVVAQRLIRVLCPYCKTKVTSLATEMRTLLTGIEADRINLCEPLGCDQCGGTGYRGRTGVYELFVLTNDIRAAIRGGADAVELRKLASELGMQSMYQHGLRKVADGVTDVAELSRVVKKG